MKRKPFRVWVVSAILTTLTGCAHSMLTIEANGPDAVRLANLIAPAALSVKDALICSHLNYKDESGGVRASEHNGQVFAQMHAVQYCMR